MHDEYLKYLKVYKPGETIIAEGGQDQDFFCLLSGTISIWKGDPNSEEQGVKIDEIHDSGTYFGEMGALLQEERTATAIANDQVKALKFPGDMLSQMILKQPKLGLKLCTALAGRLHGTTSRQQNIVVQRNEIRSDATQQFLHGKESFQKLFVMLTALQQQLQHPMLKSVIEFMATDTLLQGGRKICFDENFFVDMPEQIGDLVKKAYSDIVE